MAGFNKNRERVLSVVLVAALSACGGGSGAPDASSTGSNGAATAPSATATASGASSVSAGASSSNTGSSAGSSGSSSPTPPDTSPAIVPTSHPKVLLSQSATLTRLRQQLSAATPAATRFKAFVDSELSSPGRNYNFQAWFAALMFQISGEAKYADFAVAKVDAFVAGEEALIASGQRAAVAGDSYLDVGPLVGDVALVYDWCNARLSDAQRKRWIAYMNQSVSNVWHPDTAMWGGKTFPWSGWSVNNPANNYYYSFLKATMLVGLATAGENDQAANWRKQFRDVKIAGELVPTFERDLQGGGSREGTGYGTAMKNLYQLYDWWERSTGERIATLTSHTLASQAWMLHSIVPTLDRLAAIGDQARESSASLFDYHREYLLSLTSLFPQERLSGVAKTVLDASTLPVMQNGFELFADYLYPPANLPSVRVADLSPAYWGSGTGQFFMRSAWGDKKAAYSLFTCGPYTESHAHRDQGAFQIYRGEWLAPTSNIYSHSGIQQGEEHNNLVRIMQNGTLVTQTYDSACEMKALADNAHFSYGLARVTPAYAGKAAVTKVEREYLFIKPSTFIVFDRIGAASGTQRIWTMNMPDSATVTSNGDRLSVSAASGNALDVYRLAPTGLSYRVSTPGFSPANSDSWLQQPKRVEATDVNGTQSLFLHVMGTNGDVSSVTRSDASGQTGVQITLADGRRVTARFANDGTGGTLLIAQAGGATLFSGSLPTTVSAPPLFAN